MEILILTDQNLLDSLCGLLIGGFLSLEFRENGQVMFIGSIRMLAQ